MKELINTRRDHVGLKPCSSVADFYEADLVCLADPHLVVDQFSGLPGNFRACGATYWESDEQPPTDAPEIDSAILFSMGSTGRAEITTSLVDHLKRITGAKTAIYAGRFAEEFSAEGVVDYAATMLPMQHYFPKTKLVITQGGAGSTYQALAYGLPIAILPTHQNHQVMGEKIEQLGLAAIFPSADETTGIQSDTFTKIAKNAKDYAKDPNQSSGTKNIAREIGKLVKMNKNVSALKPKYSPLRAKTSAARKFRYASASHGALANNAPHNFALSQTMLVFSSNACCTWIPKNGCSTIRFSIAKENGCVSDLSDINWIHQNNQSVVATTETAFRSAYTFAVLRCPYSRLYSAFMDKLVNFDVQAWKFYTTCGRKTHPHQLTFSKFAAELKEMNPANFDNHWRRQVDFLLFKGYSDLFSLEDFSKFTDTIRRKIGLEIIDTRPAVGHETSGQSPVSDMEAPFDMPALELLIRKQAGIRPSPETMFSPEIVSIVKNVFKRDLSIYRKNFGNSPLMERFE